MWKCIFLSKCDNDKSTNFVDVQIMTIVLDLTPAVIVKESQICLAKSIIITIDSKMHKLNKINRHYLCSS